MFFRFKSADKPEESTKSAKPTKKAEGQKEPKNKPDEQEKPVEPKKAAEPSIPLSVLREVVSMVRTPEPEKKEKKDSGNNGGV